MGIALVIVWIIFMVITLMYTTDIGKEIYRMVEDNTLLKLIYDGKSDYETGDRSEILKKCKRGSGRLFPDSFFSTIHL